MGNPMNPFAPVSMGVGVLGGVYAFQFQHAFSMAFFAKGFIEECFFRSPAMMGYGIDGIFEDGTRWAGGNFSQIGSASSAALPYKDGEFEIAAMTNPESDMGESEILEFLEPALINLGKKLVPDFCGHGKYKGGMGLSTSQLVVQPGKYLSLAVFANCPSETTPLAVGAMGGYPALGTVAYFLHDTNMKEIIENGQQYPRDFAEARNMLAEGTLKAGKVSFHKGNSPSTPLKDGDMFLLGNHANGGYGDPIERDPSMLEDDMKNNFLTKDVIKKIYGAILDDDGKANAGETEAERQKIRDERKENSMDVKDWWKQEREKVVNKDFSELVYDMYKDIMKYEKFNKQMKKMWLLEDYTL
jgi:acetone carboxylase alpha subunit